jgi:hypothetical protein
VRDVAVALALGGLAGAVVIQSHHDEKRKSQAEKDDPDGVEWICGLVWDLLEEAAPNLPESYGMATDGAAIGPNGGPCSMAVYRRQSVFVADFPSDPNFVSFRGKPVHRFPFTCIGSLIGNLSLTSA